MIYKLVFSKQTYEFTDVKVRKSHVEFYGLWQAIAYDSRRSVQVYSCIDESVIDKIIELLQTGINAGNPEIGHSNYIYVNNIINYATKTD